MEMKCEEWKGGKYQASIETELISLILINYKCRKI